MKEGNPIGTLNYETTLHSGQPEHRHRNVECIPTADQLRKDFFFNPIRTAGQRKDVKGRFKKKGLS